MLLWVSNVQSVEASAISDLSFGSSPPPYTEWNRTYGGVGGESSDSMVQTNDGGYVLAGTIWPRIDESDFFLVKTNSDGIIQWNKTYGGPKWDKAHSVVQTSDGGYAVAGETWSFGAGDWDFLLVKTNSDGIMQWSRTYGGEDNDQAYSVAQTLDGGYAIAGQTHPFGKGSGVFWLVKTDATGEMLWNKTYGGTEWDCAYSVIQTMDRGYALVGSNHSLVWLVKTEIDGTMIWNKTYGGKSSNSAQTVVQTDDEGYALAGSTNLFGISTDFWLIKTLCVPEITNLTLSINNESPYIGFPVEFTGKLEDLHGNGLNNETIEIYQAPKGSTNWDLISSRITGDVGDYFFSYIPMKKGSFIIKAEWGGNQTHFKTSSIGNLTVQYNPTTLTISLSSSTSYIGFNVGIDGVLTSETGQVSDVPILLSYSVTEGRTWNEITQVYTSLDGSFSAEWLPTATGTYRVKAGWAGDSFLTPATATINLAVVKANEEALFAITSNSTILGSTFNSTSRELSFAVTGSSETMGYVNLFIPKTEVGNIAAIRVYFDNSQIMYSTSQLDDSWLLHFEYPHSTHSIIIKLGEAGNIFSIPIENPLVIIGLIGIPVGVACIIGAFLVLRKKKTKSRSLTDSQILNYFKL